MQRVFKSSVPVQATPTYGTVAGTYTGTQTTTIISSAADAIFYTVDGSTPTAASTLYSGAVSIANNQTIKAIAIKSGKTNSAVGSAAYVIACVAPVLDPATGSYSGSASVTMTSTTSGAAIYYTTDGSTPTSGSTLYSGAVSVTVDGTVLKAITIKSGNGNSAVTTETYTITAQNIRGGLQIEYVFASGHELEDTSGNANDAINSGGVTFAAGAAIFPGTDFLTTTNVITAQAVGTIAMTINTLVGDGQALATQANNFYLFLNRDSSGGDTGKPSILSAPCSGEIYPSTTVDDGSDHNLLVRYNGTTMEFFIDGVSAGTDACTGNFTVANVFGLGKRLDGAPGLYTGAMKKFRLWNVRLNDDNVATVAGGY